MRAAVHSARERLWIWWLEKSVLHAARPVQVALEGEDECPVCMEPFDSPVITACAHVFCRACIEQSLNTQAQVGRGVRCTGLCDMRASMAGIQPGPHRTWVYCWSWPALAGACCTCLFACLSQSVSGEALSCALEQLVLDFRLPTEGMRAATQAKQCKATSSKVSQATQSSWRGP